MQRHGIGRQLHPSQSGSTPHDRVTSPQIRSSHSLPLDRPRQSAPRHLPVVTNRPTTYRVRRHPPPIQQPFHRPQACWSASTPFTHLIRCTQIPIAHASPPTCPLPRFPPLEVCVRRPPRVRRATFLGPASANLHTLGLQLSQPQCPVCPDKQTSSACSLTKVPEGDIRGFTRFFHRPAPLRLSECDSERLRGLEVEG